MKIEVAGRYNDYLTLTPWDIAEGYRSIEIKIGSNRVVLNPQELIKALEAIK